MGVNTQALGHYNLPANQSLKCEGWLTRYRLCSHQGCLGVNWNILALLQTDDDEVVAAAAFREEPRDRQESGWWMKISVRVASE